MNDFVRPLRWSELPPGWKAIKVGERLSIIAAVVCFGISLGIQKVVYPRTPDAGDEIGVVEGPGTSRPVLSPFGGTLMGMLAQSGERLRSGQPIAWLRVA